MTEAGFFSPQISRRCWTVWRRNWEVFFKTYTVNFLPPVLEPVLYLLAIGYGLGTFVGEIDGIPYVEYIAPALLSISMMNSAFFECTYSSYVRMYYMKTFDAMIATPLFGLLVDRLGKRALVMVFGSILLMPVYLMMAYASLSLWMPIVMMGIAFCG